MILGQLNSQAESKRALEERFALRADTAANFTNAYIEQVLNRAQNLASLRLGSPVVSHEQFLLYVESMNFGPSALLDEKGTVIEAAPLEDGFLGTNIADEYTHIKLALEGKANVSNTIDTSIPGVAVVAFVTPYDSAAGRRIVSGAYDLAVTPIGNHIANASQFKTGKVYILDEKDNVIAGSTDSAQLFSKLDSELAQKAKEKSSGTYSNDGKTNFFASKEIKNTPWRIVMSVETNELYNPVDGSSLILPWVFISAFSIVSIFMLTKLLRDREKRIRLQDTSLVDLLTGVANQRGMLSQLNRSISFAKRHERKPSIIYIDLDSFTDYNQKHGHSIGDKTLIDVAENIAKCLRAEDYVGRWGADEFVVFLPDTPSEGAQVVASRILERITRNVGQSNDERISASIGIATYDLEESPDGIVARAQTASQNANKEGGNKIAIS